MSYKPIHQESKKDDRPPIIFIPSDYTLDLTGIQAMAEIFGRGAIIVTDKRIYNRVREGVDSVLCVGGPGVHKAGVETDNDRS